MPPPPHGNESPRFAQKIALVIVGLGAGLLVVEAGAKLLRLDDHVLALSFLYYGWADGPVHRISSDPFLHYELKPNSHCEGIANPWTLKQDNPYSVNIDEFGARVPTHSARKAPGVIRILGFGGSTLYGANINDRDTLPAALERHLNHDYSERLQGFPKFEVWNFGTSAYNLAQAAHLARNKLPALSPDLIIVQLHNRGARSFFLPQETERVDLFRKFEREDPDLLDEQFLAADWMPLGVHRFGLRHVAIYRMAMGAWRRFGPREPARDGLELSRREAMALAAEASARRVPLVFVAIPAARGVVSRDDAVYPGVPQAMFIDMYRAGRDRLFYDVHPPPQFMDEWAGVLAEQLNERHLLRGGDA